MGSRSMVPCACLWLLGCAGASSSTAETPAGAADTQPTSAGLDDGRPPLPSLPSDLVPSMGEIHQELVGWHAEALPTLDEPFDTKQQHEAWVSTVLEPWKTTQADRRARLAATRPMIPTGDADDAAWDTMGRAGFVHCAMLQTLFVDQAIVLQFVALPREVGSDPQTQEAGLQWQRMQLAQARRQAADVRGCVETFKLHGQTPAEDMEPWRDHCDALQQDLQRRVCEAERDLGLLAPDARCSAP